MANNHLLLMTTFIFLIMMLSLLIGAMFFQEDHLEQLLSKRKGLLPAMITKIMTSYTFIFLFLLITYLINFSLLLTQNF